MIVGAKIPTLYTVTVVQHAIAPLYKISLPLERMGFTRSDEWFSYLHNIDFPVEDDHLDRPGIKCIHLANDALLLNFLG